MDAQRFDCLTLKLSSALSRRRFGSVLAALGLAAGFGGALESEGKKKKGKNKKPKKCKKGTIKCGKKCVNPKNNALNCGRCGQRCGISRACVDGQCQTGCPGDQILCHELCVDPSDNVDHCGRCNNPCADPLTCVDGKCVCADGEVCDGDCVDLQTDREHCGSCGHACGGDETCNAGECSSAVACHTSCRPDQICESNPCPCSIHCGSGLCGDCCSDQDCIGNPNGNHCVGTAAGNFYCGCRDNARPCGPDGACSTCCSDDECAPFPGHICSYCPADSPHCIGGCACNIWGEYTNCGGGAGCVNLATDVHSCGTCGWDCCQFSSPEECETWACVDGVCV
jgi:hypothetical protein